uniref:ubiquitinyl hydrolase 1 n=1 Tax=Bionectria ochroleuca TaxID=29856 RepID=A0A8H7KET9_BIOOC
MENRDLAAAWLDVHHEAQGAVYFDKSGRIMVCARFQKAPMPLLASPFAENLEQCVVYVDEAHTRGGTDIKLPLGVRGAVTLGMGQTKDQTVQAAMRLRQLASTQSVAFVAPPAVYQSILELRPSHLKQIKNYRVNSHDVVRWLLEQSCTANEDIMSLYVAQGFDFCRRANAFWKNKSKLEKKQHVDDLLGVIRQREAQSIEELYGSRTAAPGAEQTDLDFPNLNAFNRILHQQMLNLHQSGRQFESSALAEVEQEREVEFEVEQVRENQKRGNFRHFRSRAWTLTLPGLSKQVIWITGDHLSRHSTSSVPPR